MSSILKFGRVKTLDSLVKSEDGTPAQLFHATFSDELAANKDFMPLTHIGTKKASEDRVEIKIKIGQSEGEAHFVGMYFKCQNPIVLHDIGNHCPYSYKHLMQAYSGDFFRQITGADYYAAEQKYVDDFRSWIDEFANHIFEDLPPTEDMRWEELQTGGLFTEANLKNVDKDGFISLDEAIMSQRFVFFLERQGFDGIKYKNRTEDVGSDSYVVLNPQRQLIMTDSTLGQQIERNNSAQAVKTRGA